MAAVEGSELVGGRRGCHERAKRSDELKIVSYEEGSIMGLQSLRSSRRSSNLTFCPFLLAESSSFIESRERKETSLAWSVFPKDTDLLMP